MSEPCLNLLCHARGEYANNECTSECRIHRGIFIAKQSQPHERLVSWRVVDKQEVILFLSRPTLRPKLYWPRT